MTLNCRDDNDATTPALYFRCTDDCFFSVIASFDQHLGTQSENQVDWSGGVEDHDRIRRGKGSEDARPLPFADDWTARSLKPGD